jgi:hypothetical protein
LLQDIIQKYQENYSVIPANKKIPIISDWNNRTPEELLDIEIPAHCTGFGVLIGQKYNRRLACIDVDSNDPEICERLIAHFPFAVRCYGAKGFKAFFLTDGEQSKSMYKFSCPGGGFVEVFYENKQVIVPPSLHSDDLYYTWDDDAATLLTVDYDDLPVIPFAQIETIPTLINSPTVTVANKNLPSQLQYSSDDVADGRYGVMIAQLGRIFKKYNNRPKFSQVLTEMLDFDAIHCPKNSFFLYEFNKKRAEIKTNDRSINASAWIASVARTFLQNSGATFAEESEAISTESISFNPLMPLEKEIKVEREDFDVKLIPPVWRKMIVEMSEATGVKPYPIFMAFLASLGACAQTKYKIQPKPLDEFHQYPNMAICMVANSGSKKSDITMMANRQCRVINKEIKRSNQRSLLDEEQRIQARIEALYKEAKSLAAKGEMDQSEATQKEIAELQRELEGLNLVQTEWMVEMSSIQKITLDAKNNQNNGLYFDLDEFKQLDALIRKKGNEEARTFFMKGVDGNKDYSYSTLARGKDYIERHIISILTSIQPDVLSCHIQDMHNPRLRENDGFYQRFIYCAFGEPSHERIKDVNYNRYTKEYQIYSDVFHHTPGVIHVGMEASHTYDEVRHDIRRRAMPYSGTPIGSSLFKHEGLLCRFACLYQILLSEGARPREIGRDAVVMADDLLKFIAQDMKDIFQTSQDALNRGEIERLVELIKAQNLKSGETIAQWNQSWRQHGSKSSSLMKMVDDLEMRGYIASITNRTNGRILIVNPLVWIHA